MATAKKRAGRSRPAPKKTAAKKSAKKAARKKRAAPGMSDEAVKAKTGKTWAQWFDALDAMGAKAMAHREITAWLSKAQKLPDWWAQMVTVGYERARGLRALHQTAQGFNASVSRTLAAGLDAAFEAWDEASMRAAFLKEAIAVSTRNPGKNLRFAWEAAPEGGRVEVRFVAKGPKKAQVTVDHMGLANAASVKRMKTFWSDTIGRFETLVTRPVTKKRGS